MSRPAIFVLFAVVIGLSFLLVTAAFNSRCIEGTVVAKRIEPESYYWTYVPVDMGKNKPQAHAAMVVHDDTDFVLTIRDDDGNERDIYTVGALYTQTLKGQWFDRFNTYCAVIDYDIVMRSAAPADTAQLDFRQFHDRIKWGKQDGTRGSGGLR